MEMSQSYHNKQREIPSEQNEGTLGPPLKRNRRLSDSCHQCHLKDRGRAIRCNICKKLYCIPCITRWYPTVEDEYFAEACAYCLYICNCGACLQYKGAPYELHVKDLKLSTEDKFRYSKYIIRVLLPSLKKFVVEQYMKRREEATIHDNQVWELLAHAEAIAAVDHSRVGQQSPDGSCSCLRQFSGSDMSESLCRAAPRKGSNKYFYRPQAVKTKTSDLRHFEIHLSKGEPVVVRKVLGEAPRLSWEPAVLERAFRIRENKGCDALNVKVVTCLNLSQEIKINFRQFFGGYTEGIFYQQCCPKILQLEWPSSGSFCKELPRHYAEVLRCLPFKHYTHPSAKLHKISTLELGPKICVSYGPCGVQGSNGDSISKLGYAVSDKVSILLHIAATTHTFKQLSVSQNSNERRVTQAPKDMLGNSDIAIQVVKTNQHGKEDRGKSPISSNRLQGIEDLEGGILWDIFRRQDVPKLEQYLKKEFGHVQHQMVHPVCKQTIYLTSEHKRKLKDEYGIEPWTFVQALGDAIIVPAGCLYQMRNLKPCIHSVVNFLSPESVAECDRLSEKLRSLPNHHALKEKELQVKSMTLHAIRQAVADLGYITPVQEAEQHMPRCHGASTQHPVTRTSSRQAVLAAMYGSFSTYTQGEKKYSRCNVQNHGRAEK